MAVNHGRVTGELVFAGGGVHFCPGGSRLHCRRLETPCLVRLSRPDQGGGEEGKPRLYRLTAAPSGYRLKPCGLWRWLKPALEFRDGAAIHGQVEERLKLWPAVKRWLLLPLTPPAKPEPTLNDLLAAWDDPQ